MLIEHTPGSFLQRILRGVVARLGKQSMDALHDFAGLGDLGGSLSFGDFAHSEWL